MKPKELKFEINNKTYNVRINEFSPEKAVLTVNDKEYTVALKDLGIEEPMVSKPRPKKRPQPYDQSKEKYHRPESVSKKQIKAPLPGLILEVNVKVGDEVEAGEDVLVLEAMKMENDVQTNTSGIVKEINVEEGDSVEEGAVLITLE